MSMAVVHRGCMLLFTTPRAVLLSVCMGVGGCLWPVSASVWRCGMALGELIQSVPSFASAAKDMTALMSCARLRSAPLLIISSESKERKKCLPARLLALGLLRYEASRYEASLCTTSTVSQLL